MEKSLIFDHTVGSYCDPSYRQGFIRYSLEQLSCGRDEGQKSYYTKLINEKEGWTFAGMYADEAISGANRNHRTEFNQMMQDALDGKIDYIITKSISRFARNTVDTLNCVRQLRQCDPPISCSSVLQSKSRR